MRTVLEPQLFIQERVTPLAVQFPIYQFGTLEMRKMNVDVQPHVYLGKVHGCSSWLSDASGGSFSTLAGLSPTFILEGRN